MEPSVDGASRMRPAWPLKSCARANRCNASAFDDCHVSHSNARMAWTGTVVAWSGAVLEAVADTHKFMVKNNQGSEEGTEEFAGPVSGAYALTRHPNYTGEVLHWFGTYVAGTVCFGKSYVGWIASSLGLYGIISIMMAATKGLEKRQQEKYLGDPNYENWKANVKYPLIPFVRGPTPLVLSSGEGTSSST